MKVILLWLVIMLLGMAEIESPATRDMGRPFDRYILTNNTAIKIKSDPPPDLVVNGENPWVSRMFEVEEVWPGDSANVTLKLQNVGDNGTLQLHLLNLVDEPGITPEPEPTPDLGELSQNLDMLIWWDDNQNSQYDAGESKIAEGKLKNIACITYGLGALNWMETKYLGIGWSVAHSVGNEIIGDKCTFDIQFVLD
jgi:hypothetical protein